MPERKTMRRVARDRRAGKSPGTQAGEFVREEMDHLRAGKHGARSTKQAIAIGLSKARRAGVKLPAPKRGAASPSTRRKAAHDTAAGRRPHAPSRTRSRASAAALEREGHRAASRDALARQAHRAAGQRTSAARSAAARKAARTKGPARRRAAARKAARTRQRRSA
jgi:hypothetical protein